MCFALGLAAALQGAGVTGYTILQVYGGSGRSGEWSRSGQVRRAEGMLQTVCIIRPEWLNAAFKVVERHIGVVSITDCEVLRGERF
ncbi:transcriptional regulator [Marimonas arenosa]|uniref:Transcriptional regulator n=1 Tax=Marimonas arenosa TaxID=1795305 RepID=A0AAE4B5T6_9RHOB|nr:transcriptional regulator [Marimonas arenosa]MDQ2089631.1 transcriptional regulator [Marimonas arenosa]